MRTGRLRIEQKVKFPVNRLTKRADAATIRVAQAESEAGQLNILFERFELPEALRKVIYNSPSVIIPTSKDQLFELIFGNEYTDKIEVLYDVNGKSIK